MERLILLHYLTTGSHILFPRYLEGSHYVPLCFWLIKKVACGVSVLMVPTPHLLIAISGCHLVAVYKTLQTFKGLLFLERMLNANIPHKFILQDVMLSVCAINEPQLFPHHILTL